MSADISSTLESEHDRRVPRVESGRKKAVYFGNNFFEQQIGISEYFPCSVSIFRSFELSKLPRSSVEGEGGHNQAHPHLVVKRMSLMRFLRWLCPLRQVLNQPTSF